MTAPRRGGPPANAAARGGVLILVAVVIGALLLSRGFADDGGLIAADTGDDTTETTAASTDGTDTTDDTAATDPTDGTDGTEGTDTTAAAAVRENNEIRFAVLNGSGVAGAAGSINTDLTAQNYASVAADNVPGGQAETSAIFYVEGWQAEAQKVATDLGVDPSVARPIAEIPFEYDAGDAVLIIVLGTDGVIAPS